jgi:hypothetical protein
MIKLSWDYSYPKVVPYTENHPDEAQNDWNNTLITTINQINAHIGCARIPNTKHIIVPKMFKSIFEGLIYYEKITDNLGNLSGRYNIEFVEDNCGGYINVCGVPLKIENFN